MSRMLFTAIIIGGLMLSSVSFGYSGGSGTPQNPYRIATKADLLALADTTEDYNKCFILTMDIDMEGEVFTSAIIAEDTSTGGSFDGTAFTGTFDGNGHKITNFTINSGSICYLGLFGCISSGGAVKNLGLENFAVSGSSGSYYIGGLVGYNYGIISDCYSTGSVYGQGEVGGLVGKNDGSISNSYSKSTVSSTFGSGYVGGLAADNLGSITNCYSTGVVSDGTFYVGGLVGENKGNISNCYSTGDVSGSSPFSDFVGGLVGESHSNISNCYSTGIVNGSYDAGGLVGFNDYGSISNCYSTGSVSGIYAVGGLVGFNVNGSITNCYSTGNANGASDSQYVGGLVGLKSGSGSISNCYSKGSVIGTTYVGGLVGSGGRISNCYSTGSVTGSSYVGGLVGSKSSGSVITSYFLLGAGPDNSYGQPLADELMKQQTSFVGWDFVGETTNGTEDIWRMCIDGVSYPLLWWQFNKADFVCPDGVDFYDFAVLANQWLFEEIPADIWPGGGDGIVDFFDWAVFASQWQITVDYEGLADFAEQWLKTGTRYCITDIAPDSGDGVVDTLDLVIFAQHWLQQE